MTTEYNNQAIEELSRRIDALHESIKERLGVKDQWIRSEFASTDKRILVEVERLLDIIHGLEREITMSEKHEEQMQASRVREFDQRMGVLSDHIQQQIAGEKVERTNQFASYKDSHKAQHETDRDGFQEFKLSIQVQLSTLQKNLDALKEERGLFVLRESFDTKLEAIQNNIDVLERTARDHVETSIKQLRDSHEGKISSNANDITKINQGIQVMNARNQQSIIALGILLTVIEILLRARS